MSARLVLTKLEAPPHQPPGYGQVRDQGAGRRDNERDNDDTTTPLLLTLALHVQLHTQTTQMPLNNRSVR